MTENRPDETEIPDLTPAKAPQNDLPTVASDADDDDDGIFLSWPGSSFGDTGNVAFSDDSDDSSDGDPDGEEDEDEESETDDGGVFSPFRPEKKKRSGKQKKKRKAAEPESEEDGDASSAEGRERPAAHPDEETRQFAFRQAEASDREESEEHRRKPKKKEEDNEATLSSMKYYRYTEKLRGVMLRRVLPLALVLLFGVGFLLYFFRLQHLTFDNLTGYAAEDVYRASGLKKNMFLFSVNGGDIKRRLRMKFPYIEEIEVERELPDTVHLIFTEDNARFYTMMYDEYFVISRSLRVLARCDSEDELPPGLRMMKLPAVSYAVVGHELEFFDISYADFLAEIMETFEDAAVYAKIHELDLSNRYDLSFRYDDRFTFDIGTSENLDTKLLYVKSLVESLDEDDSGTFTLIGNKMATYSADAPGG